MKEKIRTFIEETTDYVLNNDMSHEHNDIKISISKYEIQIPNNADTYTKLVEYLESILEDVED